MLGVICSWIKLHVISNHWGELLWDVCGAIDCVFICDGVEWF